LSVVGVLTIVQEAVPPSLIGRFAQPAWFAVYPAGTPSVAVQVAPALKPVTVKLAGSDSDAEVSSFATDPDEQVRVTVTLAALLSVKSLFTTTWAERRVLTIVHVPADNGAEHVPVEA